MSNGTSKIEETVARIVSAPTLNQRVAEIRKVPGRHGSDDHASIFSSVAREAYVPHLTPTFAHISRVPFYDLSTMEASYAHAYDGTDGFTKVDADTLAALLVRYPDSLLAFRTICGLTKDEFAHAVEISESSHRVSGAAIDKIEKGESVVKPDRAAAIAATVRALVDQSLFGAGTEETPVKQAFKPDTSLGWSSVESFAQDRVPFSTFLHQRHYGGAFRQLLDATSGKRGDIIEDATQELFEDNGIPYIRTGSHNQSAVAKRFGLDVRPAPDFVIFDDRTDTLRAILECKGANDGGTARDKAGRFKNLRSEAVRLGGVHVVGVLGGVGWKRTRDALGPVVEATEGLVFTLETLPELLTVEPFPPLIDRSPAR